jgi:hypothetical protein
MRPKPIAERIDAALATGARDYHAVAGLVFPQDQFPRAWRYPTRGGPPGCFMALSAACRKHGFPVSYSNGYRRISPRKAST